ncbi:MAG: citrate synthase [Planctomycetota bacterium]|nr:citrate synthase [Planctomycetota bacterium]
MKARLQLHNGEVELPIVVGTEDEHAIDVSKLRDQTGYITLDDGYGNTGSCRSAITFIDGEKGILRYRGIPIQQLAQHSTFIETAMLLIYGELPKADHLLRFRALLTEHEMIHEGMRLSFQGFPSSGHPMAILSSMINTLSCYHEDVMQIEDESTFESAAARLISKIRTVAAASYRTSFGLPIMYPSPQLDYCRNFLHMMFSIPNKWFEPDPEVVQALNLFLMLHADHEQNCSTSTVRMVASSGANLFASCAAGVCALWGPLHGGANMAVIEQLGRIAKAGMTVTQLVEKVKKKEEKLFGFGHRVYKSYDPRAHILRDHTDKVLTKLGIKDPLLDIARELEEVALKDDYFKSRDLYPNVDFYSGILLRAIRIPVDMYTVMFAIGRLPGWIAHWKEVRDQGSRIYRPRQVYVGSPIRDYVLMNQR